MSQAPLKRCVLYLGGYDPVTPERFFARQDRQLARYRKAWDAACEATAPEPSADGVTWSRSFQGSDAEGATETDFRLFAWDDIVKRDFDKPHWKRLPIALGALADFTVTGTVFRYFRHAWRFGLYFLAPYAATLLFIVIAVLAAVAIEHSRIAYEGPVPFVVGLAVLALLLRWPGKAWYVGHLLDARSFMGQYLHGGRADMEARLDRFAGELVAISRAGGVDELVVIGHSQGSVFALEMLQRALLLDPVWPSRFPAVSVLTVGSCVLQLGLHPRARDRFIPHLEQIGAVPALEWMEFQALSDPVNFYKTDPGAILGLSAATKRLFPQVFVLKIKDMLAPETYARVRKSLFRLHYQFVTGNDRRYFYDFYRICCGPLTVRDTFSRPGAPRLPQEKRHP